MVKILDNLLMAGESLELHASGEWNVVDTNRCSPTLTRSERVMSGSGGEPALRAWLEGRAGLKSQEKKHGKV
jgi:hypothetical protein